MIKGAVKAGKSVADDWSISGKLIHGVKIKEFKNVPAETGILMEFFRKDWQLLAGEIRHAISLSYLARAMSEGNCHRTQTDNIVCIDGRIKLALYDNQEKSPTLGRVNVHDLSPMRPMLVSVPPFVWHAFHNINNGVSHTINLSDREYNCDDPDLWRLPMGSSEIPFEFER